MVNDSSQHPSLSALWEQVCAVWQVMEIGDRVSGDFSSTLFMFQHELGMVANGKQILCFHVNVEA